MLVKSIPINKIVVYDRIRESVGDIKELQDSILEFGLLNPITVEKNEDEDTYTLFAGERRLKACKELKFSEIDANILDEFKIFWPHWELFEDPCKICDCPITEEHHILPRHFGGNDNNDNKVRLCPTHHTMIDFLTKDYAIKQNPKEVKILENNEKRHTQFKQMKEKIILFDEPVYVFFNEFVTPKLPKMIITRSGVKNE